MVTVRPIGVMTFKWLSKDGKGRVFIIGAFNDEIALDFVGGAFGNGDTVNELSVFVDLSEFVIEAVSCDTASGILMPRVEMYLWNID